MRPRRIALTSAAAAVLALAQGAVAYAAGEVGVSPTGSASGSVLAVSGTGNATSSGGVAVSGGGSASGTVAVAGVGDATSTAPTGAAVSGLGAASGGTASADGALNWVNTPNGPVPVGAAIGMLQHRAQAVVAEARGVVDREVVELVTTDPISEALVELERINGEGGGGGQSGCPVGANCSNVRLVRPHRFEWDYTDKDGFRQFYGITVASYLVPASDPGGDYTFDLFFTSSTITGDAGGICGIEHSVSMTGPAKTGYYSMMPTGETNVSDGGNRSTSLSVSAYGFTGGYSWSHPTYSGKIRGDYNPGEDRATGSWTTSKNTCPASRKQGGSAAFESGASYVWPRVSGNSGRQYSLEETVYYQDLTW